MHSAQRFFSLTINTIEVSIFGEVDLVKELYEALQDLPFDCQAEISTNDWEVLQIENHSDQFGTYAYLCSIALCTYPRKDADSLCDR